jgi:hypothetical protein
VDKHKTLIILGVRDLAELLAWEQLLLDSRIKYSVFTEPDRGDEKTAIAVHPLARPYLFRKLKLL